MIKLSVIIPVYNVENCLGQTLDTIRRQTFKDWECICVDDGSSDKSGEVLDRYSNLDSRFAVYHIANSGVSAARNFGLMKASGEYVTFIDGDDLVEDYRFAEAVRILDREKVDLLRTDVTIWYEKDERPTVRRGDAYRKVDSSDILGWGWEAFLHEGQVWHLFVRRDKVPENSFPYKVRIWEDTIFSLRLLRNIKTAIESEDASYVYRLRSNSAWHQNRSASDTSDIQDLIVQEFENAWDGENSRLASCCARALWNNIFDWLRFSNEEVDRSERRQLIESYLNLKKKGLLLKTREISWKWRVPYLCLTLLRSTFAVRFSIFLSKLIHKGDSKGGL